MTRHTLCCLAFGMRIAATPACHDEPEPVDPFESDCRAWCRKQFDCPPAQSPWDATRFADCTDACVDAYELQAPPGTACREAFAAAMDCLAAISCEDYIARMSDELAVCEDVVPSYYDLCPGVFLAP